MCGGSFNGGTVEFTVTHSSLATRVLVRSLIHFQGFAEPLGKLFFILSFVPITESQTIKVKYVT